LLLVLGITALALALRLYHIGLPALNNDETLQMNGVLQPSLRQSVAYAAQVTGRPPLPFALHRFWLSLAPGANRDTRHRAAFLRGFEAVVGTAAVALAFWALWPLTGRRAAVLAAAVSATAYILIWYSREIRGYIVFYTLALAAYGFFIRILATPRAWPRARDLAGFVLASAAGGHVHFNTYLAWPVFALLFLVWEAERRWREGRAAAPFRWRTFAALALAGGVILLAIAPTLGLFFKSLKMVYGMVPNTLRPGLPYLGRLLSRFGWGVGWEGGLWWGVVAVGAVHAWRANRRALLLSVAWVAAPLLVYVYGIGMRELFANDLHKYAFFLYLGFLPLAAFGFERLGLWLARIAPRPSAQTFGLACVAALALAALPVYRQFYAMRGSTGWLYTDIEEELRRLGARNLLLDNYYDLQYLRHYIPREQTIATPPVFNNGEEYGQLNVHRFLRETLTADPLLVHYTSGAAVLFDPHDKDYGWIDALYARKRVFENTQGNYLLRKGLNFFPGVSTYAEKLTAPVVYANLPEDLPALYAARGARKAAAFGPGWLHLTALGYDNVWRHQYVSDGTAALSVVCARDLLPARVTLTLELLACCENQVVRLLRGGREAAAAVRVAGKPFRTYDLAARREAAQLFPLGRILRRQPVFGSFPHALDLPFAPVSFTVEVTEEVTAFEVRCDRPEGIVVGGARAE